MLQIAPEEAEACLEGLLLPGAAGCVFDRHGHSGCSDWSQVSTDSPLQGRFVSLWSLLASPANCVVN